MPHKGSSRGYASTPKHPNPAKKDMTTTAEFRGSTIQQRIKDQIKPGTNPDPMQRASEDVAAGIKAGIGKVGAGLRKAVYPAVRPATAAEDETSKLQGQRAYYEGKIARQKSPSTVVDK